jgi:hypothetical protein
LYICIYLLALWLPGHGVGAACAIESSQYCSPGKRLLKAMARDTPVEIADFGFCWASDPSPKQYGGAAQCTWHRK